MSILVQDIVEQLAAADLYGSNIFTNANDITAVNEAQKKRLLLLIKQAVSSIYRHFPVSMKTVWLLLNPAQSEYLIEKQQPYLHRGYHVIDKSSFTDYPKDAYGLPIIPKHTNWDDDLKRIHAVFTIDGMRLRLNTPGSVFSVYLTRYNQIKLADPTQFRYLQILYQATMPKIESFEDDTGLPDLVSTAIRFHVGRAYFSTVTSQEGMKRLQWYNQQYQAAIQDIEVSGYFQTEELILNHAILDGKWNI